MDGIDLEDFVIVDYRSGKEIISNRESVNKFRTSLNEKQYMKVKNHDGDIILLHNHPQGGRLSASDILSAYKQNNVIMSIVAGHDGSLHYIYDINRHVDIESIYNDWYNYYKKNNTPAGLAKIKATDRLYEMGVFKYLEE